MRQDHTISPYASVPHVSRHHASTAACPNVSDVANDPSCGTGWGEYAIDRDFWKAEYFYGKIWTAQITLKYL